MDIYKPHLNSPPHWFVSNAIYIVTGATLHKKLLLDSSMDVVGIGFAFDPIQKRYQIAISYGLKKD